MSEDPVTARRARGQALIDLAREDLDLLGVEELRERIALLQAEVGRAQAQIDRRGSIRAAADALFSRRD